MVKKVASPPRISRLSVEPRAVISKYRSNPLRGAVCFSGALSVAMSARDDARHLCQA